MTTMTAPEGNTVGPALAAPVPRTPPCEATAEILAPAAGSPLRTVLLESRQRWRDLVALAADLAFETDEWGRLTFLFPDPVLGWPCGELLGQAADQLLAEPSGAAGFNPFRPTVELRDRRAWLRRKDGSCACVLVSAAPLLDSENRIIGARGLARDVTVRDAHEAAVAAALRRGEVLDHILWRMRQEVLAPHMMNAALEALAGALGAEGAAVLDPPAGEAEATVRHQTGAGLDAVLPTARALLGQPGTEPRQDASPCHRAVLVCAASARFTGPCGLMLWRTAGARPWDADDIALCGAATGIIGVILEHESLQREMSRQARTDPLTGLLNRRAFMAEIVRRMDRLEREGLPGTLLFVDLDHFKALNDAAGHEAGDEALRRVAELLRAAVRPADMVARLGGDEFAVWLDGADELTGAERAEMLRVDGPRVLADLQPGTQAGITMSIGIATSWPGRGETIENLLQRADKGMYRAKRAGRGKWCVAKDDDG